MSVRLCRWGNSTGLRVPASLLAAAGLEVGRYVTLRVLDNGDIRVRPVGLVVPAEADDGGERSSQPETKEKEPVW